MWKNGIYVEKPIAWTLDSDKLKSHCSNCLKFSREATLLNCSACKFVYYCGKECQKSDWKLHKLECEFSKNAGTAGDESYRMVLRLAKILEKNDYELKSGDRSFSELIDHKSEMEHDYHLWRDQFKSFATRKISKLSADGEEQLINSLFCKISMNCFSLTSIFGVSIGIALCLKLSKLNHSCKPTARLAFRGTDCCLVPVRIDEHITREGDAIPDFLTHSYIDELVPLEERRKLLLERYKFVCECEGCMDVQRNADMIGYKCPKCSRCTDEKGFCARCNCKADLRLNNETMVEFLESVINALKKAVIEPQVRIELLEKAISVIEGTIYEFNVKHHFILREAYEATMHLKRFHDSIEYGETVLEINRHYQDEQDLAVVWLKYNLAKLYIKTAQFDKCVKLLNSIVYVIEKVFTKDSYIWKELSTMQLSANKNS